MKPVLDEVKTVEEQVGSFMIAQGCLKENVEQKMIDGAALALKKRILKYSKTQKKKHTADTVFIACGSGNNGADGYTLAGFLYNEFKVVVLEVNQAKSAACIAGYNKVQTLALKGFLKLKRVCDCSCEELELWLKQQNAKQAVVVDCIYGTGFHGKLEEKVSNVIRVLNDFEGYKIACDIPSGLDKTGEALYGLTQQEYRNNVFMADLTVTMFARKTALYSDAAKDCTGKVKTAKIFNDREALSKIIYKAGSKNPCRLCTNKDIKLPLRKFNNVHKGSFGHTCVILGEKPGAALIAAKASFKAGSGLSSVLPLDKEAFFSLPVELMKTFEIPANCTAISAGSGLGKSSDISFVLDYILDKKIPAVLDADILGMDCILSFLEKAAEQKLQVILTPHPKELSSLCRLCGIQIPEACDIGVKEAVLYRKTIGTAFTQKYPGIVLVMKSCTTLIACSGETFIVSKGAPSLAKGGSGDVLAGVAAGLLAQKYSALDAAVTAVLMHAAAGSKTAESYSLTPFGLIENL